jgi:hypothetical protein
MQLLSRDRNSLSVLGKYKLSCVALELFTYPSAATSLSLQSILAYG